MLRKIGMVAVTAILVCRVAYGLPDKPAVTSGQASFNSSPGSLTITNSPGTIINWQGFSIGAGEQTRFNQQSSSSAVLNRVVGADPSNILGSLTSNGRVYLINPHGIIFGRGATIDTSGFIASTLNISDRDFLEGRLRFEGGGAGLVRNEGSIRASGDIYLVGSQIENTGLIRSDSGSVLLAAGQAVTISGPDAQGVQFALQAPEDAALNLGTIEAKNAASMFAGTLHHSGDVRANRIILSATGEAMLEAGSTVAASGEGANVLVWSDDTAGVHGTITAKDDTGGKGGFVETSARTLDVNGIRVDTGGGEWLIDPNDFTVAASGGNMTGATLSANLGSGNVTILSSSGSAGSGDIHVNDAVSWSANLLTLTAARNININAVMTASGTSRLALNYDTANGADIAAGGAVKVGMNGTGFTGRVDFPGRAGTGFLTINGNDYTVIQALGAEGSVSQEDLQGINGRLNWNYALGGNIDATASSAWNAGAGFVPIGDGASFAGRFNGLGHTISNLTINRPGTNSVGLFGSPIGKISNVGVVGGSIAGASGVGGIAGELYGSISNSYASMTVTGTSSMVGGLAGYINGPVSDSHASGNVNGNGEVGGLVGHNNGNVISNSYSTGSVSGANNHIGGLVGFNTLASTITGSYASGSVSGTGNNTGGLVGSNSSGTINNSHATGSVTGTGSNTGGLVGSNSSGTISNGYATGSVTGTGSNTGGLVGSNSSGTISNGYATGSVTGSTHIGGLVGVTDGGTVSASYATGSVTATGNFAGGLVGMNTDLASVSASYATGNVTSTGGNYVGGLVGSNEYDATVSNSYATGSVAGIDRVGGLTGRNIVDAIVSNSYATGSVTGSGGFVGGLIGDNTTGTDGIVIGSFWDRQSTGQTVSDGGTGMTTAQMKDIANFTSATAANGSVNPNWNFSAVWNIDSGATISYPYLRNNEQTPHPGCSGACGGGGGGGSGGSGTSIAPNLYRDSYSMLTADSVYVLYSAFLGSVYYPAFSSALEDEKSKGVQVCR